MRNVILKHVELGFCLQISSNGVRVNDVFIGYNKDTAAGVIYNVWESYKQENNHGIAFKEVRFF